MFSDTILRQVLDDLIPEYWKPPNRNDNTETTNQSDIVALEKQSHFIALTCLQYIPQTLYFYIRTDSCCLSQEQWNSAISDILLRKDDFNSIFCLPIDTLL
jgi:hypothetical protein